MRLKPHPSIPAIAPLNQGQLGDDRTGQAGVRGLPRIGAGGMLPKSPLRSPERRNRAAFDGRSSRERGIERGRSAKTVASQRRIAYPVRAMKAKMEILVEQSWTTRATDKGRFTMNVLTHQVRLGIGIVLSLLFTTACGDEQAAVTITDNATATERPATSPADTPCIRQSFRQQQLNLYGCMRNFTRSRMTPNF